MNRKLLAVILPILLSGILLYFTYPLNSSAESDSSGLIVSVRTDKTNYLANENVNITIDVTNTGDNDVTLGFVSSQVADFEIIDDYNKRVFYWSFDKRFYDLVMEKTISPGKTEEFLNTLWNQTDLNYNFVSSGNYSIIGWTPSWDNWIYSEPVTIQISNNQPTNDSNLTLTISTDKKSYDVSDNVEVTIMATNTGDENITLVFPNSGIADYEILNEHRKRVYFWSYNRFVLPVVTYVIIPVGKTVALLNDTWDSNYTEGNYSARAWIPLEPRLYSEYHGFQIYSKLNISLSTNKQIYRSNESVNISIYVTNTGQEDKTLKFSSTQIADFEILNEHGERIYLWSYDKGFLTMITEIMFIPGGTIEFLNASWDRKDNNSTKVPPGNYTIIGWTNDNKLKLPSKPVPIQIKSTSSPEPPPETQPNLTLTLETEKSTYGANEEIFVTFQVTNNEAEIVTLNFSDGLFANFEILNQNGERVYLLSTDEEYRIDYKRTNITISPGETELLFISNSTLLFSLFPKGNYSIKGWLLTESRIYSNIVSIEISWDVIVTLKTDKTTYFVNDNITVNISFANIGKSNVTFWNLFKGADFEFINENGNQFWSRQYVDADIIWEYTIPPGTSLDNRINDTFIAYLPEGYTTIKCWTWGSPRIESNEVTITILDPNAQYGDSDPDRDLLTNSQEYLNNTDPQNPDTDDDGLTDGSEITFYGTDPLNHDTDGDGTSDGMEVDQDTDPLNSDEYPLKVDESTTDPNYLLFAVVGITIVIILVLLAVSLNMKWKKK